MNGVLGHDSAPVRLYWAEDNSNIRTEMIGGVLSHNSAPVRLYWSKDNGNVRN